MLRRQNLDVTEELRYSPTMADFTMLCYTRLRSLSQIIRHLFSHTQSRNWRVIPAANMKTSAAYNAVDSNQREAYYRGRDDPFFDGMRRGEAALVRKGSAIDFQGNLATEISYRSASDVGDHKSRNIIDAITEEAYDSPKNSPLDIVLEPIGRTSSGRWSKTSSPLVVARSDANINLDELNEPLAISSPDSTEGKELAIQVSATSLCIHKLNAYLKAKRDVVNAGVPGMFLHAVIRPDGADVGSVASTIMYAFHVDETIKSNHFFTVPVINMKRADLDTHVNVRWLLNSCHIDLSSLIFIDEIDLAYYDLFGGLKLVLVSCDKIPSEQEALRDSIVEVFHCEKSNAFSWVHTVTEREDVSCCTGIAENFATTSPEILSGQGFSRLLKEFKKWTISGKSDTISSRLGPNIGMSSIGMSVAQLLSHDSASVQGIIHFQKLEKLSLLMVVSGYYDPQKRFKREILVSAESSELMKNLLMFLNSSEAQLPLRPLNQSGLRGEMRVFEINKVTSRRTIERLLEDFASTSP
ncbi:hypothetical protein SASPL_144454 [Salvia splendens]|uniref:Exopolyphosphatase n=1 Tax=Salvia splendens TaxID=180675 RepID=A0A8X8WFR4_SALSN|nr:hypothetical protein SASPL_144454 [Salvia splendens]